MPDLNVLKNALLTVTQNVGHYEAREKTDAYIVWAEDGQADSVWADGRMQEQAVEGTVDYFTKTENDTSVQSIQNALNNAGVSFPSSTKPIGIYPLNGRLWWRGFDGDNSIWQKR